MKIVIKVLKGQDCTLDVTPATTVIEIKQLIEKNLSIPIISQKLLLLGRTLGDELPLSSYPIKDGTKLNLIVMKQEGLRDIIYKSFRKYYNEQQSELLAKEFMTNFERRLKEFSLDDIERLADHYII